MRRIAYLSPLNPAPSGISDYSEELLPYLAQYAEIVLYIDDRLQPSNQVLLQHMDVRPISKLERDQRRRPYDAILYHIGNSPVHAPIWRMLQRLPGVVVLHEFVLHHFMLNYAATVQRDVEIYRAMVAERYGAEGERIARLMLHGRFTEAAFDLPLCEPVISKATGLIAHSRYVLERVAALRCDLPVAHVPMGIPLPPPIAMADARARLGLSPDMIILASFGHINPYKRIEPVLRALRGLRADYPNLHYLLVGSISPNYDVRSVVARAGLADTVTIVGYPDRSTFADYIAAADICLNLRHPTAGETSASLLRLLGAGKPTLVTATGSFTELPPDVVAHVDPDASEGDLILAYCRLLIERPDLAALLGANARRHVEREHTLEGAAAGYMRFLAAHYGWEVPQKQRTAPLWELEEPPRNQLAPSTRAVAAVPSLSLQKSHEQATLLDLAYKAGDAIAELGGTEDDTSLIAGIAQAIGELIGPDEQRL